MQRHRDRRPILGPNQEDRGHAVKLALCLDGLPVGDLPPVATEAERRGFRKVLAAETTGAEPFMACPQWRWPLARSWSARGQFYPLFPGHFPPSLAVPPADLDGLRRNVAAILGGGLA